MAKRDRLAEIRRQLQLVTAYGHAWQSATERIYCDHIGYLLQRLAKAERAKGE